MNKFFTKVASLCVGLAMAAGVGVAVSPTDADRVNAGSDTVEFTHSNIGTYSQNSDYSKTLGSITLSVTKSAVGSNYAQVYKTQTISFSGATISQIVFTTVTNYTGSGFGTAATTGGGTFTTNSTTSTWTGSADDIVFTASVKQVRFTSVVVTYEAGDTYTVTYHDNGASSGAVPTDSTVYSPTNNTVTVLGNTGNLEKSNCIFSGWCTTSTGSGTLYSAGDTFKINGNINLYALWTYSGDHAGTIDDPYSVSDVIKAIDASAGINNVYATGIINGYYKSKTGYSSDVNDASLTDSGQCSFFFSADGSEADSNSRVEAYLCKDLLNAAFTKIPELGATVVVYGSLTKYNSTYEFGAGCYLQSYTAPASSKLTSITLSGDYPTSFDVSDTFSYSGLVVTAHYENGSEHSVSNYSVSTPDMTSAGQKTVTVTYTENQVEKSAEYTITVNAVTLWEISFKPGEGSGEMESVHVKEGADYTLPACTFTAPEGKVFDYWEVNGDETTIISSVDDDYEATAIYKDKPAEVTDTLNNGNTVKNTDSSYINWTSTGFDSGAEYAGQSAGGNESIQLRSNNSNSGIVTTTSGGTVVSVKISFESHTSATRTVSVYGKNSAYSAPTELYNSTTQGTLLGEVNIDNGASQTIEVEGSYQYVGIRSKSGAMYIESIAIVWNGSVTPPEPKTVESISVSGAKTDFTVGDDFETTGLVVTAHYDDSSSSVVTSGYVVNSSAVDKTTAGVYTVTVTYEECSDSYDVTYTAPEPVVNKTYKKVKTNLANFSGDYLIVNEEASLVFNGSLETLDAENNVVSVTISDEKITAAESNEFTIAKTESAYSVKSHSGYYIGQTSDANGLKSSTSDPYDNAISYVNSEAVDMDIVSGGAHLRYNSASNQNRFRYYKSSSYTAQKAISLYMQVDAAEAVALEILNQTYADCQAFVDGKSDYNTYKTKMAGIWTSIGTLFNAIEDSELKAKLVDGNADEDGTMLEQALARYDYLTAKYALDEVITGRDVPSLRYVPAYNTPIESDSAMIVVVIAAVVSLTSIAVLLVIKRRKTLVK